jgi:hypothetical protein
MPSRVGRSGPRRIDVPGLPSKGINVRRQRHGFSLCLMGAALFVCGLPLAGASTASACSDFSCGLPAEGAYAHLLVGRVTAVASQPQLASLYHRMRAQGRWKGLPDNPARFPDEIQTLVIDAGDQTMAVNMSRAEMAAAPIKPGDFVRYAPHHGAFEKPPADPVAAAFWAIDGCVAILCRAGDTTCVHAYRPGAFDKTTGIQLSPPGHMRPARPITVDVNTLIPRDIAPD